MRGNWTHQIEKKLANQLKFPAKIQNRGERFGRKRKNMYLCRPYMGVGNLSLARSGRQAESAQGAPARHLPPSPGQEGRHKYPITPPLSRRQAYGFHRQALSYLISQLCTQIFFVRWHTMGLFGFDSGSRRYVSMWS